MPDHDLTPDPIDQTYAQAEATLDDEAARAARRARVLGAVAGAAQAQPANEPPARRRTFFGQGRWLAAASVAGLSLLVGLRYYQPPETPPPQAAPPPVAAQSATPEAALPEASALTQPQAAPAPAVAKPPPPAPVAAYQAPAAPPAPAKAEAADKPAVREVRSAQDLAVAAPAPPPPPPAPRPEPPSALSTGALARAAAPPPPAAAAASDESGTFVESVVVTGARVAGTPTQGIPVTPMEKLATAPSPAKANSLRAAAAAGRMSQLRALLNEGLPVDTPDENGDTALIKAVRGKHADAAALLRRQGASLDLRNAAGESARDLAEALGDKAMNRALGL